MQKVQKVREMGFPILLFLQLVLILLSIDEALAAAATPAMFE